MHELLHTNPILHAIYHSVSMLPLLYVAYLIMEWLEHKAGERFTVALQEDRRTGPIVGATLGFIPFCGITDLAAGLFSGRVISVGTLIAFIVMMVTGLILSFTGGQNILQMFYSSPLYLLLSVLILRGALLENTV